jgi:hypothetical protein
MGAGNQGPERPLRPEPPTGFTDPRCMKQGGFSAPIEGAAKRAERAPGEGLFLASALTQTKDS